MKKLSISTFWIFAFCLCLRAYSYLSYSELRDKINSDTSLLNEDKKKTIALLNTLSDLTQQEKTNSNYRELTSDVLIEQRNKDSKIITFIEEFYSSRDNLTQLKEIQKDIKKINKRLSIEDSPLEYLEVELLFYFVIKENFDLRDFQKHIIFEDLGFNSDELIRIRSFAFSRKFKIEILKFKNIYVEEKDLKESKEEILARLNNDAIEDKLETARNKKYEFLNPADEQEIDLEQKLIELDYTDEEVEEMLSGFEL